MWSPRRVAARLEHERVPRRRLAGEVVVAGEIGGDFFDFIPGDADDSPAAAGHLGDPPGSAESVDELVEEVWR